MNQKKKNFEKIKEDYNSKEEESGEELLSVSSESSNFSLSSMMISLHNIGTQQEKKEKIEKTEYSKKKMNCKETIIDKEKEIEKAKNQEKINDKNDLDIQEKNSKEKINIKYNYNIKEKNSKEKVNTQKNIEKIESKKKSEQNEKRETIEKTKEKVNSSEKIKEKNIQKGIDINKTNNKERIVNEAKIKINEKEWIEKVNREKQLNSKEKIKNEDIRKEPEIEKKMINLKENLMDNKYYRTLNSFDKLNNSTNDNLLDKDNNIKNNANINISNIKNRTNSKSNETQRDIRDIRENEYYVIKNMQNTKINLHKNKINNIYFNNSIDKINPINDTFKQFSLVDNKDEIIGKNLFINDNTNITKTKQKLKKFESVSIKKRMNNMEYNNSNKNIIKLNTEITFPQIKMHTDEINVKDNNKLTEITQQHNSTIGYLAAKQNEFGKYISQRFRRNQFNFNNLFYNQKKSNSREEKQKNKKIINSNEEKEIITSNNVFNLKDNMKREIKKANSNNTENLNNNAFLTSLNNINNNYNYYYNNNNNLNDNNNIINLLNTKNNDSDKNIDKFNSKIDFINVNIKSVNKRINVLEDRYQTILNQLNNIYKIVSNYYHHKRKSRRSTIKEKTKIQKKEDLLKNKKFMNKISGLYTDIDYNLRIPNNEYNNALKKIEPFLIKKFNSNQ